MTHPSPIYSTTHGSVRPRSPHLSIYRWTITMAMSAAHRLSGLASYLGMGFLAYSLWTIAWGGEAFALLISLFSLPGVSIVIFFILWASIHHLLGGIRHLLNSYGWALDPPWRDYMAWSTLVVGLALVLVLWFVCIFPS